MPAYCSLQANTECSTRLWRAGFNSAWASWGELVGSQPGKRLKLTAKSHQKTPPSSLFVNWTLLSSDRVWRQAELQTLSLWEIWPAVCHLYCAISLRWLISPVAPPTFFLSRYCLKLLGRIAIGSVALLQAVLLIYWLILALTISPPSQ